MGSSGIICRKDDNEDFYERLKNLKTITENAGLVYKERIEKDHYGTAAYVTIIQFRKNGNILRNWNCYVDKEKNWQTECDLRSVFIDAIYGYDDMLLDFLYEYFKVYPNEYFISENGGDDLVYTKEDVRVIKEDIGYYRRWYTRKPGERITYKYLDEIGKILINYADGIYLKVEWEHGGLVVEGRLKGIYDGVLDKETNERYCACLMDIYEIINNSINYDFEEEGLLIEISQKHEPTLIELDEGKVIWKK